jgi:hypothetical protein
LVYLLYIPCVALSALGFGFFTKYLIKKQEGERADNRAEDRNALNNGISSVPDQVGLLSSNGTAHVVGSDLVHVVQFSPVGSEVHPTVSTYNVVGGNHAEACQDNTTKVSDQSFSPAGSEVHSAVSTYNVVGGNHTGACQDNTTAERVPYLTEKFSNIISSDKQNIKTIKPEFSNNSPSISVRSLVKRIEEEKVRGAPKVNSNSRQI